MRPLCCNICNIILCTFVRYTASAQAKKKLFTLLFLWVFLGSEAILGMSYELNLMWLKLRLRELKLSFVAVLEAVFLEMEALALSNSSNSAACFFSSSSSRFLIS